MVDINSPRDAYFHAERDKIRDYYLADPSNPYQQSGRSSGAERWEETRRCLVKAIHRRGDFMDVGCANGLLLQTLISWARDAGFELTPFGIDFVGELVELARERFPELPHNFEVSNAWDWTPERDCDFVRANLEYVPQSDWVDFVRRQYAAVRQGGRLVLCHYRNLTEPYVDPAQIVESAGYRVTGRTELPGTAVVWIQRPE